jgi:hypothetical protein
MEIEDDGATLKLSEDMIAEEITKAFKNRFINRSEKFAIPVYGGACILICHVDKITPIEVKQTQSFGIIEEQTDIICKAKNPKALKLKSTRMQEKQVFKKNMNF